MGPQWAQPRSSYLPTHDLKINDVANLKDPDTSPTTMATSDDIYRYKIVSIGSLLLSVYGNVQLLAQYGKISHEISVTPFLNFLVFLIIYWVFYYIMEIVYIQSNLNLNIDNTDTNIINITKSLISFNLINLVWCLLFQSRYYLLSEIVVIIELFVILNNYLLNKLYSFKPVKNYLIINLTVGSLPLSWIFFQLFWNGSLMIRVNNLATRVLANVFIWDYLIIGVAFLFLFNDYTVGISLSYLILGIALNQLFVKLIALQWIFAFIISGLLFFLSVGFIFVSPKMKQQIIVQEESVEQQPLIN